MSLEFEYRQLAAACLDLVKRAVAPADKTRLLLIAESWLALADRVRRKTGNAKHRTSDRADYPPNITRSRAPSAAASKRVSPTVPLSLADIRKPVVIPHRHANSGFGAPNRAFARRSV